MKTFLREPLSASLKINPLVCLLTALALTVFSVKWVAAWLLAMAIHELCHGIGVLLCGGRLYGLEVGLTGAKIRCDGLNPRRELICDMAGPAGSLLLLLLLPYMPRVALCGGVQGICNLMPLLPLDGGRALQQLFCGVLGMPQQRFTVLQKLICGLLAALSIGAMLLWKAGWLTLAVILPAVCKNFLAMGGNACYNRGILLSEE